MKQKYRKLAALAAALTMTVSLVSCGAKEESVSASGNNTANSSMTSGSNAVNNGTGSGLDRENGGSPALTRNDTREMNSEKTAGNTLGAADGESPEMLMAEAEDCLTDDNTNMVLPGMNEPMNEEYAPITENGFKLTSSEPLSTFSTDVDTASYTNVRRMINNGLTVYPFAVRPEEFINYFSYDYAKPEGDAPIAVTTELSDCPWNENAKLLLVGVQAKELQQEKRPDMNLVLLIDVSGSMISGDKLPLAVTAFRQLAESLTENDRVSIVTYSGKEQIVLDSAKGSEYDKISLALGSLSAQGATAGEAGINMAYSLAEKNFIKGGNNRIIMATDGDLNVGVSSPEELKALVEQKRESGVFLSVLGFGSGNLKDDRLETLADNGNGNYSYIDTQKEAEKVLGKELNATLVTVAKDVKAQIEFDPAAVEAYRLVGYENRALAAEDFTDDTKDAGDMGAGHSSTALFEIIPAKGVLGSQGAGILELPEQEDPSEETAAPDKLLTVKLRYKLPDEDKSKEITAPVAVADYVKKAPANLAFASCAAEFAMYLRQSEHSDLDLDMIDFQLKDELLTDEYRKELKTLVSLAKNDLR